MEIKKQTITIYSVVEDDYTVDVSIVDNKIQSANYSDKKFCNYYLDLVDESISKTVLAIFAILEFRKHE